jgi:hypothetical protein
MATAFVGGPEGLIASGASVGDAPGNRLGGQPEGFADRLCKFSVVGFSVNGRVGKELGLMDGSSTRTRSMSAALGFVLELGCSENLAVGFVVAMNTSEVSVYVRTVRSQLLALAEKLGHSGILAE